MQEQRAQAAKGLVLAYRQQVEEVRQAEMVKAQQWLAQGLSPNDVLERLTRNLANKLMHTPCVQLKEAAATNQHQKLAWSADLLGIHLED